MKTFTATPEEFASGAAASKAVDVLRSIRTPVRKLYVPPKPRTKLPPRQPLEKQVGTITPEQFGRGDAYATGKRREGHRTMPSQAIKPIAEGLANWLLEDGEWTPGWQPDQNILAWFKRALSAFRDGQTWVLPGSGHAYLVYPSQKVLVLLAGDPNDPKHWHDKTTRSIEALGWTMANWGREPEAPEDDSDPDQMSFAEGITGKQNKFNPKGLRRDHRGRLLDKWGREMEVDWNEFDKRRVKPADVNEPYLKPPAQKNPLHNSTRPVAEGIVGRALKYGGRVMKSKYLGVSAEYLEGISDAVVQAVRSKPFFLYKVREHFPSSQPQQQDQGKAMFRLILALVAKVDADLVSKALALPPIERYMLRNMVLSDLKAAGDLDLEDVPKEIAPMPMPDSVRQRLTKELKLMRGESVVPPVR